MHTDSLNRPLQRKRFLRNSLILTSLSILLGGLHQSAFAQKKPLTHDVYDSWESVSSVNLSKDGRLVYYSINPQEGDGVFYIKDVKANKTLAQVPRAAAATLSPDGKYVVMSIKPTFQELREARIQKKKGDDLPKDSLGLFHVAKAELTKIPLVQSFKLPAEAGMHAAYMMTRIQEGARSTLKKDTVQTGNEVASTTNSSTTSSSASRARSPRKESVLVLHHLEKGVDTTFQRISDYFFSKDGSRLYFVQKPEDKDTLGATGGLFSYDIAARQSSLISKGRGEYKQFTFDEDESKLAFLAYKGDPKSQVKLFSIYTHQVGSADTASVFVDAQTKGLPSGWRIADQGSIRFSKDGQRLFLGIAPIPRLKDTTLVETDHAKVDIWHWRDEDLQTEQLVNLRRDLNRSYQAVISLGPDGNSKGLIQLTNPEMAELRLPTEGSQEFALGISDFGKRFESQWMGSVAQDLYTVNTNSGSRKLIKSNLRGNAQISPLGNYVIWFDREEGNWYVYEVNAGNTRLLNAQMSVSFADEDDDRPTQPSPYGIAGWGKDDTLLFVNDKYDVWVFDLKKRTHWSLTNGWGRKSQIELRYVDLEPRSNASGSTSPSRRNNAQPIDPSKPLWLSAFNHVTKEYGWFKSNPKSNRDPQQVIMGPYRYVNTRGAEGVRRFVYTKENYEQSPNVYVSSDFVKETKLSETNPQQQDYNWGTVELFHWTTPKGHKAQGLVYKPEDFDPNKKYPVIAYFYERLSNELYHYIAPTPTPSRLNISFFVSNGYVVFAPDIHYEIGYPGRSAEEFINSGMAELSKFAWVDRDALGIQGQSWGGYQVAHLITRTDMYAAAWSGAPVVNMTSAYGGIRWQTGKNRQFQYEKTQSRIGATLWERQDLYIENSPLFFMDNVRTPVAIMHNDEDGAVPWYQGIEMFTALKRLGKPVWMLNYNGDGHNLTQRQNRKDIQRRQLEFFDHFLKGKPAAPWIERGVPAVLKGIDWGFGSDK